MKSVKLTSVAMAIVNAGVIAVLGTLVEARSPSDSSAKIVTGEVAQVEGEFHMAKDLLGVDTLDVVDKSYVITDQAGKEVRLELSDATEIPGRVIPGDKIEAEISSDGHTLSVTRLEP